MRIIAGAARGRRITVPSVPGVRATLDRVREALFSMLHGMVCDGAVLDLFAGSGSLGIEAISRGARHAVFVDSQRKCLDTIAENLLICGFEQHATLVQGVIPECFSDLEKKYKGRYDIVFIDPPYRATFDLGMLEDLSRFSLLQEDAKIIIEHDRRKEPGCASSLFQVDKRRVYGDVALTLLTFAPKR